MSHLFTVINKISDWTRVWHLNPQTDKLWMYCLVSVSSTGTYKAAAWFVWADRTGTTWTVNIQLPSASRNGCHPTKTWGMLWRILGIVMVWVRFPFFWNMMPHHWVIGSWRLMTRHRVTVEQKLWDMVFSEPFRPVAQWHPCLLLSQCLTLQSFSVQQIILADTAWYWLFWPVFWGFLLSTWLRYVLVWHFVL